MELIEKYEYLKSLVDSERKESFLKLMSWIESETDYLYSPASHKYHLSCRQGLLMHSVSVAATMIRIKKVLYPSISDEQCVIVALLHDLGKAGYEGEPGYIENKPTEKQKQYGYKANPPYLYNENIVHMPHAHRSAYLVSSRFQLSPEEYQAIIAHDGQYTFDNKSYALKEAPLTLLLHYADSWSCTQLENKESMKV